MTQALIYLSTPGGGGGGTPKTFGYLGQAKLIPYLSPIYGKWGPVQGKNKN